MAPAKRNPFERLPEELVCNILEKVLWGPFEFGNVKVQNKLLLALVCKQFKELISDLANVRNLDWEIKVPKDKDNLLELLGDKRGGRCLEKLVLDSNLSSDLLDIFQAILLVAQDTLEEIFFYVGSNIVPSDIDWDGILTILQQCKKLTVLHITVWRPAWFNSIYSLALIKFSKPINPFYALRSLTLYGLSISGQSVDALSRTFPSLDYLEIYHLNTKVNSKEVYRQLKLIPAQKLYCWEKRGAKMDIKDPRMATVPRSLQMMFGFLRAGGQLENEPVKTGILGALVELSTDVANQQAIAHLPGSLESLVSFVRFPKYVANPPLSSDALKILHNLALLPEKRGAIANVPGFLSQIKVLLNDRIRGRTGHYRKAVAVLAATLLNRLTFDPEVSIIVANMPKMLEILVNDLDTYVYGLSEPIAGVMLNLTSADLDTLRCLGSSQTARKKLTMVADRAKDYKCGQEAAATILLQLRKVEQTG